MKKILTLTALISLSVCTYAQNLFPENGNVGIGTVTPTEKLSVLGNVSWSGFNSGNPRAVKIGFSGGNYGGIGYNLDFTGTTGLFNRPLNDRSSYLEFWSGGFKFYGTTHMSAAQGISLDGSGANLNMLATLTPDGKFGIGTDIPTHMLTLNGDIKINGQNRGMFIEYASLSETLGGATTILGNNIKTGNGTNTVRRFFSGYDAGTFLALNYYNGITFHTGVKSPLGVDISSTDNEVMRITQNGNVGIGISAPAEKLAVNGTIRSKEVKVETANWPDYVFKAGYQLQTLTELQQFINENGHLPHIPSAKEAEANGIALGEMNKKLLQKIEELTLYIIEQEKDLKEKSRRMNLQEERMNQLEAKINQLTKP